jgi:hypothetical protein
MSDPTDPSAWVERAEEDYAIAAACLHRRKTWTYGLTGFDPTRLDILSAYAVRVRYPGDDPSPEEAREAVEIAKAVRRMARTWLGVGGRASRPSRSG